MKKYILFAFIIVIVLIAFAFYWVNNTHQEDCLEEATVCPIDFGNDLEENTNDWSTFMDDEQNFSFKYPDTLNLTYIREQEWPPILKFISGDFMCNEKSSPGRETIQKIIDEKEYCIHESIEGAAGSVYTTYTYETMKENKFASLQFTLQKLQCLNYEKQQGECKSEQEEFDIDALALQIINSIKFEDIKNSQQITLEGEYVCLPHANTSGPQTLECAFGLKIDSGEYFALDMNLLKTTELFELPTGSRIKIEGLLTPIELLSTDIWKKYNIKGMIAVKKVFTNI